MSETENSQAPSESGEASNADPNRADTVVATSYVPESQYARWENEAEKKDQSVSSLISSMVEVGLNDIEFEHESSDDLVQLRSRIRDVEKERDELRRQLQAQQRQEYQVGMGRIKELIIENPGITQTEIFNYISKCPQEFARESLKQLESSEFRIKNGQWFPPEGVSE